MNKYSLTHLGNAVLLRGLRTFLLCVREATAMLLAHIAEVDVRKLYAPEGYSSMFAYCVEELHLSEDVAAKRIQAARAARRFPALFVALEEGRLHLTAICLIAPHLTPENVDELIEAATHRKKSEIQEWLVTRFPGAAPVPAPVIRPVGQHAPAHVGNGSGMPGLFSEAHALQTVTPAALCDEHALAHVGVGPNAGRGPALEHADSGVAGAAAPASEHALAHVVEIPKRFLLQVTLNENTHERLRYAQALLSHSVSPSDISGLLLRALEALIEKTEKRKLGASPRSQAALPGVGKGSVDRPVPATATATVTATATAEPRCPRKSSRSRYVPTTVRRAVWERDCGQCTYVSTSGHRCLERRFLEFDHVDPLARGGKNTVEGLRLRCRAHNQLEADRAFGTEFMNGKRAEGRSARRGPLDEITMDVLAGLRGLGCRADEARRAAEFSASQGGPLEQRIRAGRRYSASSAASFSTVFQFRPVPRTPSFRSIRAMVSRDRPTPSG